MAKERPEDLSETMKVIGATLQHVPRSTGRPRAIEAAAEQRMRAKFKEEAIRQLKYRGRLPGVEEQTTVMLARKFAEDEGVTVGDRTLRRHVVEPVLRELKRSA
jgi:hypothetical protein